MFAEYPFKRQVIEQPTESPDINTEDFWFWKDVTDRMVEKEVNHPDGDDFDESKGQFETRLLETINETTRHNIEKAMGSMPKKLKWLKESGGEWCCGD